MSLIEPGTRVPSIKLARADGTVFTEADLAGKTTVLVFYPFAFSPVCTDQLNLYDDVREQFAARGADAIYGVSCDSTWSQTAFRNALGVSIEQLSDFEPKGATCRAFGVYHPDGFPQRALVIVNPEGTVRWSYQADSPSVLPGADLILDSLGG